MKIPNHSYRKVTCCKTNSWKSGGRHLPVFQVFPDNLISLIHRHTNTTWANLLDINTGHASKILDMTSWVSIIFTIIWGGPSLSGSIQPHIQGFQSAGGMEVEGEDVVTRMITAKVRNSHSRHYFHCIHEELFSCIVSILASISIDCILSSWSCAMF